MMKQGRFISIEGIEGAGKSTGIAVVRDFLSAKHIPVYLTREPGGTPIAESIRHLLLHHETVETMHAETELLLMFAARAQHLATCIKPRLAQGDWVVSDRFIDATYAYQSAGRALPASLITCLDKEIVGDCYPDLTILLDISPEAGLLRAASRGHAKDRIEREQVAFFERVRDAYLLRQQAQGDRIKLIDASLPLQEVKKQIEQVLITFMAAVS